MAAITHPTSMDALVFRGARQIALERVPTPSPATGEVLIKVSYTGICGSDLHGYLGHSPRRTARIPLIMGHEFAGRIVGFGPGQAPVTSGSRFEPGDRVVVQPQITCGECRACRAGRINICPNTRFIGIDQSGGLAEFVSVPANRIFRIPDKLSERHAALVETLAVEVHLFKSMVVPVTRSIAIFGAGAQGLFAVQLARLSGIEQIIVSDLVPARLSLAQSLGAHHALQADQVSVPNEISHLTEGWGVDLAIDAVGSPAIRQDAATILAPGGRLALVGLGKGETTLNFLPVINKEQTVCGVYSYTDADFQRALELIANGTVEVDSMINDAPLHDGANHFEQLLMPGTTLTKVILAIGE